MEVVDLPGGQVPHLDASAGSIDRDSLLADANVQPEPRTQRGGGLQQQGIALGDHTPDVVRQAAVRERHVATTLDDDDLGLLIQATQAGGGRHAAGHTADDDDSLGAHGS